MLTSGAIGGLSVADLCTLHTWGQSTRHDWRKGSYAGTFCGRGNAASSLRVQTKGCVNPSRAAWGRGVHATLNCFILLTHSACGNQSMKQLEFLYRSHSGRRYCRRATTTSGTGSSPAAGGSTPASWAGWSRSPPPTTPPSSSRYVDLSVRIFCVRFFSKSPGRQDWNFFQNKSAE